MWVDPVVEEVHRVRMQLLARAKGNLSGIIHDAMARQKKGGRKVLAAAPCRPEVMTPVVPVARVSRATRKRQAA